MATGEVDLLDVISDQNRRIQELERLLEEQKRLRLQDSNQVEEKAAKIKEWVTNKLKELENQNKNLRDQNRKQKELVESLSRKLASVNATSNKNGVSLISIGDKTPNARRRHQESPLYDCVNLELDDATRDKMFKRGNKNHRSISNGNNNNDLEEDEHYKSIEQLSQPVPPPPPPHQCDRWEYELYNLAERTFSSLRRDSRDDMKDDQMSRKSCSMKNDIISVFKPQLTTINGDQVVDELELSVNGPDSLETKRSSRDHSSQSSVHGCDSQHPQSLDSLRHRLEAESNVLSSPIRTRSGKDSILRTQSVRRNPAPEKLYDFIASDLVKRGHLVKHGALRKSPRWFVLKNFHLYAYKSEADETDKSSPSMALKLDTSFRIQVTSQSGDGYPFKLLHQDKSIVMSADTAQLRDEWINILTVAINLSDVEPSKLTKSNAIHEGLLSITRHGHSKRCHAVLVNHVVFFLKSQIDPTPLCYLSVKGAKIREVLDSYDYDLHEVPKQVDSGIQDSSLAIYPRYSVKLDPLYISPGSQIDTDEWFYYLSRASGMDQSCGTEFERILTKSMLEGSMAQCTRHPTMVFDSKPIAQPLTTLPNETLRIEALELFKSISLFAQVPIEPIAIDYHICLLQNCLKQFLRYPELRNEFFAQLIKQSNVDQQEPCPHDQHGDHSYKPTGCERLQALQMLAIAVSLNLPRGRLRWWLTYRLKELSNTETNIGKYAAFIQRAMDRTASNGGRDTVPSRTEIMGILLRNPYDHSKPHSLPVSFADGSHLVVGADGSTTVEEFMGTIDDPDETKDLHILEPQRKVLDVVGWWEQQSKQNSSGRHHNIRAIKLFCRKRLALQVEENETERERLLIVHQVNQEIVARKIPLDDVLIAELGAIMSQLNHGDPKKKLHDSAHPGRHKLAGKTTQDCIRIYLNCIRRLNIE